MKKKLLSVLLAAGMVMSMAGCGNSNSQPAASNDNAAEPQTQAAAETEAKTEAASDAQTADAAGGEAVTLKWAIWDKESTPYWQALADAYKEVAPNVTIEMVDLGSTDYMTVLATELSGEGSDFDVVTIKDVPGYATLVQKNAIIPLDDYISADGVDLSKYAGTTDQ